MATVPAPTPLRMHNAEPAVGSSTTDAVFLSVRELQFPRVLSTPPPDVALPLTLMPRPPASPDPSLPVCVSDPKAVRGGGTIGGAAAAFSSSQQQQRQQQQQWRQRQQQQRPCGATGSSCSPGISPQSGPEPLSRLRSSALGSAFHSASRVSAAGGKATGSAGACVQPVLAPPCAPGFRAAGRAGVPATSSSPVSGAGGEPGREGRRRGTSSEPLPVASRLPAAGGGGERSLRRRIPRGGRKRLCEELPGTPSPTAGAGARRRGAPAWFWLPRPDCKPASGRGTKRRWAFLLFV